MFARAGLERVNELARKKQDRAKDAAGMSFQRGRVTRYLDRVNTIITLGLVTVEMHRGNS